MIRCRQDLVCVFAMQEQAAITFVLISNAKVDTGVGDRKLPAVLGFCIFDEWFELDEVGH